MADIYATNVLTPTFITESVKQYVMNENALIGNALLPVKERNTKQFKVRINKNQATPIEAIADGATPKSKKLNGGTVISYDGVEHVEKIVLTGDKYLAYLQVQEGYRAMAPGATVDAGIANLAQELLTDIVTEAGLSVATTLENLRFQSLTGTVTLASGETIDYNFAGARKPSAGTVWSDSANATPVADLRAWQNLYTGSGYRPVSVGMNLATYSEMVSTAEVKSFIAGSEAGAVFMQEGKVVRVAGLNVIIYNEGYINSSGTFVPYIANDKVIMIGEPTLGATAIGEMTIGLNAYEPNQAGLFVKVNNHDMATPPCIDIPYGGVMLPAHYFDNGDAIVYASV